LRLRTRKAAVVREEEEEEVRGDDESQNPDFVRIDQILARIV